MTVEEQYKSTTDAAAPLRTYEGAVVVVTGGASGIGKALAEALTQQGAHAVVLVDRQATVAEEVAVGLWNKGAKAEVYEVDVRSFADMETVVKETAQTYGRLDYIFNNAGVSFIAPFDKLEVEDFNYVLDVNVRGVFNGSKAAYAVMNEQGFGHIVNIASMAGLDAMPFPGHIAYVTSKHAVIGLSKNLRVEAARHGVRVTAVCPGFVDTPILRNCGEYGNDLTGFDPEDMDKFLSQFHPMDPNDFARRVLRAVTKNKPIVVPGLKYKIFCFLGRMSPSLSLYLARKNNEKICAAFETRGHIETQSA